MRNEEVGFICFFFFWCVIGFVVSICHCHCHCHCHCPVFFLHFFFPPYERILSRRPSDFFLCFSLSFWVTMMIVTFFFFFCSTPLFPSSEPSPLPTHTHTLLLCSMCKNCVVLCLYSEEEKKKKPFRPFLLRFFHFCYKAIRTKLSFDGVIDRKGKREKKEKTTELTKKENGTHKPAIDLCVT